MWHSNAKMRQCNARYLTAVTKIVARRENVTTRIYFWGGMGPGVVCICAHCAVTATFVQAAQNLGQNEVACVPVKGISL